MGLIDNELNTKIILIGKIWCCHLTKRMLFTWKIVLDFSYFNIQCAAYPDENGTQYVSKLISWNAVSVGIILEFVKVSFPFLCNFGIWNQFNRSFIFLSLIRSILELFVSAKFGSIRSLSSASGTLFTASGKSSQHIMWVPIPWPLLSTEQIRAGTLSSNSRL